MNLHLVKVDVTESQYQIKQTMSTVSDMQKQDITGIAPRN